MKLIAFSTLLLVILGECFCKFTSSVNKTSSSWDYDYSLSENRGYKVKHDDKGYHFEPVYNITSSGLKPHYSSRTVYDHYTSPGETSDSQSHNSTIDVKNDTTNGNNSIITSRTDNATIIQTSMLTVPSAKSLGGTNVTGTLRVHSVPSNYPSNGQVYGPSGAMYGPPIGPMYGPQTYRMYGQQTGLMSTGLMYGPPTGPMYYPSTGPMYGQQTGLTYGPPTGPMYGRPIGPMYGPPTGPMYGSPTGPMYRQQTGPMYGPPTGPMYGQQTGPMYGQQTDPMYGPPTGPIHGPQSAQRMATKAANIRNTEGL